MLSDHRFLQTDASATLNSQFKVNDIPYVSLFVQTFTSKKNFYKGFPLAKSLQGFIEILEYRFLSLVQCASIISHT